MIAMHRKDDWLGVHKNNHCNDEVKPTSSEDNRDDKPIVQGNHQEKGDKSEELCSFTKTIDQSWTAIETLPSMCVYN